TMDDVNVNAPADQAPKMAPPTPERPTTDKVETAKNPVVRYAEMYRRTSK
nr:hypothetical protein [Tanacetum cinerariifolium]